MCIKINSIFNYCASFFPEKTFPSLNISKKIVAVALCTLSVLVSACFLIRHCWKNKITASKNQSEKGGDEQRRIADLRNKNLKAQKGNDNQGQNCREREPEKPQTNQNVRPEERNTSNPREQEQIRERKSNVLGKDPLRKQDLEGKETRTRKVRKIDNNSENDTTKAKELKELTDKINALGKCLNNETLKSVDFGSSNVTRRDYGYNSKLGLVSSKTIDVNTAPKGIISKDFKKVELDKDQNNPQNTIDDLEKIISPFAENETGSIVTSSWARKKKLLKYEKNMIDALTILKEKNPKISLDILTQAKEAKLSHLSLTNLIRFKNPANVLLAPVTPENVFQWEGGRGSTQSHIILPEQGVERSANWVDEQLKLGKNSFEVKETLRKEILNDLNGKEAVVGKRFCVMHGLYASHLSNDKVVKALGVNKEDWLRAQIPIPLSKIVEVLKNNYESSAGIVTLAAVEAFLEKYGKNFSILNMKEDMPLFDPNNGASLNEAAKICLAHGAAVDHFNKIKDVMEQHEEMLAKKMAMAG